MRGGRPGARHAAEVERNSLTILKEKNNMAGTKAGGQAAAATNKKKYGEDFYGKIGAKGGRLGRTGGFAANRKLARIAGAKGGRLSRRGKAVNG
jgi:general stress protein YciG